MRQNLNAINIYTPQIEMTSKDKILYSYDTNQKDLESGYKRPNSPSKTFNTKMMISKAYLTKKPRKEKSVKEETNKRMMEK